MEIEYLAFVVLLNIYKLAENWLRSILTKLSSREDQRIMYDKLIKEQLDLGVTGEVKDG